MSVRKPVSDTIVELIHDRSLGIEIPESFGSSEDLEHAGYEGLLPAYAKVPVQSALPRTFIGGPECTQPYEASILNCSALSFGPLSKPFILAMNQAAHLGGFYQNTGEAGISPFHYGMDCDIESDSFCMQSFMTDIQDRDNIKPIIAGDVVWQLGTGYFGCRKGDGTFDAEQFMVKSRIRNVKMIEVKLSQGVEPRKEMPVHALTPGMAKIMGITPESKPSLALQHSGFSTPIELMEFIAQLRELSGGKPVGIKLGLTHRYQFLAICKAMLKTGITPDFMTIDGMEAGTAAATRSSSGYTGTPLNEAIVFIHNALVGTNLREDIRLIASGRIFTERDIISKLARGADLCASARALMLAVGCEQQRECYLGTCQKGIATQDPQLAARFDIEENVQHLVNFHRYTLQGLNELLAIAGLGHPSELGPGDVYCRLNPYDSRTLDELYEYVLPGALLQIFPWLVPKIYRQHWQMAKPEMPFSQRAMAFNLHR